MYMKCIHCLVFGVFFTFVLQYIVFVSLHNTQFKIIAYHLTILTKYFDIKTTVICYFCV